MTRVIVSMLMLGSSFAPVLCWAAEQNADPRRAVAESKKLGGKVNEDEKRPGRPVYSVKLRGTHVTDAELEHIKGLPQLQSLDLWGTQVTDAGLEEQLKGLKQLRRLGLAFAKVTDAGLERLKGLAQLGRLDLRGTQVTDAGLKHLRGLTQLRTLRLSQTQVSDEGPASLLEPSQGSAEM